MKLHQRVAHFVCRYLARALIAVFFNVEVWDRENLPRGKGGAIIAANHISYADSVFLPGLLTGWPLRMLAKNELFKGGLGKYLRLVGQIPVRGAVSREGLETAAEWIKAGGKVGIFPEGTRNGQDINNVYAAGRGLAQLVQKTGALVYPVGIFGTHAVDFKDVRTWKSPVLIIIGEPVEPMDDRNYDTRSTQYLDALGRHYMRAIAGLGGRKYVDVSVRSLLRASSLPQADDANV